MGVRRGLVCSLAAAPPPCVLSLLRDFRRMVDRGVRGALDQNLTPRGSLLPFRQRLAREYRVNGFHARSAMDTALAVDKGPRRRIRKGRAGKVPPVLNPFLIADDATIHLKPVTELVSKP
jgi:hypothetical protein